MKINGCNGFHFINVVWGESYTKLFLDVCLPSQLSNGNLQAFRHVEGVVYKIYTTLKDAELITKHPVYLALSNIVKSQIKIFDLSHHYLSKHKHSAMNYCHHHAIVEANQGSCALVFLSPDTIWADGSFKKLIELAKDGKRTVMIGAYRTVKETLVPEFIKQYNSTNSLAVSVSSRELVQLFLKHIHLTTKALFWDETGCSTIWPSVIIWPVGKEGILAKHFHIHPLMVIPLKKDVLPSPTIDGKYISLVCPNLDDVYIVEDTDEIFACELSNGDIFLEHILPSRSTDIPKIAQWMKNATDSFHKYCFKNYTLKIHADNLSPKWEKAEAEANSIARKVFQVFENS